MSDENEPQEDELVSVEEEEHEPRNGVAAPPAAAQQMVKVTEQYTRPIPQAAPRRMAPPPPRPATAKEQTGREYLNDLASSGKSSWNLCIIRTGPAKHPKTGETLPTGTASRYCVDLMTYDQVRVAASQAWGSGNFRIVVVDENGKDVVGTRAVLIEIPLSECPPYTELCKPPEDLTPLSAPALPGEETELQKLQRESKIRKEQAKIELENAKGEIEKKRAMLNLEAVQRDLDKLARQQVGGDEESSKMTELRSEIRDVQRASDVKIGKLESLLERIVDKISTPPPAPQIDIVQLATLMKPAAPPPALDLGALITGLATAFAPVVAALSAPKPAPVKDDSMEKILLAILAKPKDDSSEKMMMAAMDNQTKTLMAVMTQPKDTGGDAKMMELIRSTNENQAKAAQRDNDKQTQLMTLLMNAALSRKGDTLTPEVMIKFMEIGKKDFERAAAIVSGNQPEEAVGDSYDPKLGIGGNLVKAMYEGIRGIVGAASQNPELVGTIMKMFNTARPSEEQMWRQAQASVSQGILPGVMMGQPQLQAPQQFQPQQSGAGYEGMPNAIPYNPQQPAPMQPNPIQQQGGFNPPPMTPQPQAAPPPQQLQQQAPPAQIQAPRPAPKPQPAALEDEHGEQVVVEDTPQQRLLARVSDTIIHATGEITDKVEVREWPQIAHETWPLEFKRLIVVQDNANVRMSLIQQACDQNIWANFYTAIMADQANEVGKMWAGMNEFIELNRNLRNAPVSRPVAAPVATQTAAPMQPAAGTKPEVTGPVGAIGDIGVAGEPGPQAGPVVGQQAAANATVAAEVAAQV